jgi:chromosome segregation protein
MLKALELVGFKSFADKTRFEFPPGITVVVGPNGSGKSNIVDAIKWVLGEQSAKSLRGKDMADVIFKGGGEGSRRMLNTAEATIVFDNAEGRLPVDAPEVHVTRRVYRSGEGEFLINRQPCRLKDIKDLFRGTGVGTDAYSLIEQGKVDQMLQASPKDRRAMFEEAAGISRFKAKKIEAQRRLDRVEQNLLRLSDIVDEVESRLRSVRSQATKARRYREHSDRLQQLRTHVGHSDWRQLALNLRQVEEQLAEYRNQTGELAAQEEAGEARALELDVELANSVESTRLAENRLARTREQIAVRQSSAHEGHVRLADLEENEQRHRQQLAAMTGRAGDVKGRLRATSDEVLNAEGAFAAIYEQVSIHEKGMLAQAQELDSLRSDRERLRDESVAAMRAVAQLGNRISSLQSQIDALSNAEARSRRRLAELDGGRSTCLADLQVAETSEAELLAAFEDQQTQLVAARQTATQIEKQLDQDRERLAEIRQQHSASKERAAVLEELERNHEGLTTGVREILDLAQQVDGGPFAEVRGLVADLLQVGVDIAPIVDVALGDAAQHIALSGSRVLEEIQAGRLQPSSRVGFVRLDTADDGTADDPLLDHQPGVLGRLDRMVSANGSVGRLVRHLLGDTWLVESVTVGLALHAKYRGRARFVTEDGALVQRDGTLLIGPRSSASTIVSRRSELRACQDRLESLASEIETHQTQLGQLSGSVTQQAELIENLDAGREQAGKLLAEQRMATEALRERCDQLGRQIETTQEELDAAVDERSIADQEIEQAIANLADRESAASNVDRQLLEVETQLEQRDAARENHAREATAAQVELAKGEQQLSALRAQMTQFQEDQRERAAAIDGVWKQLGQSLTRQQDTRLEILRSTSSLATLCLQRETLERQVTRQLTQQDSLTRQRSDLSQRLQQLRRQAQKADEQVHRLELSAGEFRHQQQTLAERLRDDYGIEVADLEQMTDDETGQREAIDQEIAELRRKINNIGAVNMEALNELDDLEERFKSLSGQFQDLTQAKEALERIIVKINADSRRLFQDTLEAIRTNFQSLYRKAFGGGRADLVLEEGVDVLEAGIDIIATPPGKPSFNNSLLSGGEKALTAVSLLLAIFQYRPSPFCVLDEVDAPFDEANIGRFVDVLKSFLGWTKFVIVTHSKQTMTAATTLYGVTMQESGVSKRVSVSFEDVSEDGHISAEAIEREKQKPSDDDERGAA